MGIEFREGSLVIANKTSVPAKKGRIRVLLECKNNLLCLAPPPFSAGNLTSMYLPFFSKGMIFNVSVGFSGLRNKGGKETKPSALFVGDTVIVNEVSLVASISFVCLSLKYTILQRYQYELCKYIMVGQRFRSDAASVFIIEWNAPLVFSRDQRPRC